MSSPTEKLPPRNEGPHLRPPSKAGQSQPPAPCQGHRPPHTPRGPLAQARPRRGHPIQASLCHVLALTWRARGASGPWDTCQHCVHSSRDQVLIFSCRKSRTVHDLVGQGQQSSGGWTSGPQGQDRHPLTHWASEQPWQQMLLLPLLRRVQRPGKRAENARASHKA